MSLLINFNFQMWQWDDFCVWIKKKQEKTTKIERKKSKS